MHGGKSMRKLWLQLQDSNWFKSCPNWRIIFKIKICTNCKIYCETLQMSFSGRRWRYIEDQSHVVDQKTVKHGMNFNSWVFSQTDSLLEVSPPQRSLYMPSLPFFLTSDWVKECYGKCRRSLCVMSFLWQCKGEKNVQTQQFMALLSLFLQTVTKRNRGDQDEPTV